MIYTLTCNPALDYVVKVDDFQTDKVNRIHEEHIFIGGKGINVSYILQQLGYDSIALGFEAGFTGQELLRGIKEDYHLQHQFIHVDQGMTRINVKLKSDEETEINGVGPLIEDKHIKLLEKQILSLKENDIFILSGSIPSCLPNDLYERLLSLIKDKHILTVVDATNDLLVNVLQYHPFLIKPNNHEIEEIFKVELKDDNDIIYYAKKLQDMGAKNVLVSLAGDGSLLVDEHQNIHRLGVCQGTVKNSVGAGDSMVAGFVAGYLTYQDYDKALLLATASGGATAFSDSLATKEFIYENLKQLESNI